MKVCLIAGFLLFYMFALSSGAEETMGFDANKDRSKVPWNQENYDYAVKKTQEAVTEKLRDELKPKELKNETLRAKLSESELKRIQDRYENSFKFEKQTLEKHLATSMEAHKDMIGRLSRHEIDESVQMLLKDFGKGEEDFKAMKEEL